MTRLVRPAAAAVLVLGFALLLTPLGVKVATQQIIPAADRYHYADALLALAVVAGLLLYVFVSLLHPRRTYSPAGSPTLGGHGLSRPGTTNPERSTNV